MMLLKWEDLPPKMQNDEVRPYYEILAKKRVSLFCKRVFDIFVSTALILLLSPLLLALAIAIKLDSKGTVFYRQTRITQYGKRFRIFKLRTMIQNADRNGASVTLQNDARITRVGGFIRKTRLDEIPQLFNVFLGEMTFVGVRPEIEKYVEIYTPEMMATLLLPAGVTSLASIRYKDEASKLFGEECADEVYVSEILPSKMDCNLRSIKEFGFWRDVKIMLMTVLAVLGKDYDG